jgi:hypothetical protein
MCLRGQYLSAGRAAKAAVATVQHTQSPLPCFSNVLECLHNYNSRVILIKVSEQSLEPGRLVWPLPKPSAEKGRKTTYGQMRDKIKKRAIPNDYLF